MTYGGTAYLHLSVDSITATNGSARTAETTTVVVAPVGASLAVRTIASHMASVTTDATDDVGGEVALLRTVVLAVSDLTT